MIGALVVLIVMSGQQPARDTRPATLSAGGAIAGGVTTDEARPRPLRRVRVTLLGQALDLPRTEITADDGTFVFDRVPPGRYTVSAAKDGYVSMAHGATRPGRPGAGIQMADEQRVQVAMRLPRGAVITGTVLDIDGQPAAGVAVSALMRRFTSGSPSGDYAYIVSGSIGETTDDRGEYRIYGLPAGDYLVAAQPNRPGGAVGPLGTALRTMSRGMLSVRSVQLSQTFYPATSDLGQASRVTLRAGEERAGIDIQLEYVALATVRGSATVPAEFGPARITLSRTDETARPPGGPVATADAAGRFQFPSVAPGRYRLTARSSPASAPAAGGRGGVPSADTQYAVADVAVNGDDVEVALVAQPGLSIAGRLVFESARGAAPQLPAGRLNLPVSGAGGGWPMPPVVVDGTRFRVDGIAPGRYRLQSIVQGIRAPIGSWWLTSIAAGGRELLDAPLDIQQGVEDAVATFTDTPTVLTGSVTDAAGAPAPELYVVAFSVDRAAWFSGSRRVAAMRPTPEGRYTISNLPPGEYRVAVADLDQNEWFDPAVLERLIPAATPVAIAGVDRITVDLIVK